MFALFGGIVGFIKELVRTLIVDTIIGFLLRPLSLA